MSALGHTACLCMCESCVTLWLHAISCSLVQGVPGETDNEEQGNDFLPEIPKHHIHLHYNTCNAAWLDKATITKEKKFTIPRITTTSCSSYLSFWALHIGWVQENSSINQSPVNIGHHRAHVPSTIRGTTILNSSMLVRVKCQVIMTIHAHTAQKIN